MCVFCVCALKQKANRVNVVYACVEKGLLKLCEKCLFESLFPTKPISTRRTDKEIGTLSNPASSSGVKEGAEQEE